MDTQQEISKVRQSLEQHQNRATQLQNEQPWTGPRYRRSEDGEARA